MATMLCDLHHSAPLVFRESGNGFLRRGVGLLHVLPRYLAGIPELHFVIRREATGALDAGFHSDNDTAQFLKKCPENLSEKNP
jgi:hypothetical protein